MAIGLCGLGVGILSDMQRAKIEQAKLSSTNIVSAIVSDVARTIELYDLSLQAVVDGLDHPEIKRVSKEVRQMILFDRAATATHLGRIRVLDELGHLVLDSRDPDPPRLNLSVRDYFQSHKQDPSLGLYIGRPFVTAGGHYAIGVSRRLSRKDGSFAGVVAGTLWLSYFHDLFRKVALEPHSVLTLARTDGTMLMRAPFNIDVIGRNVADTDVFRRLSATPSGYFAASSGIDGSQRLYTFQHVAKFPLILSVGRSAEEVLADWRKEAINIGAVIVVLAMTTIGLALFSAHELRRRAEAERSLEVLATTDGLTGLANRRHFDDVITREWKRGQRQNTPISLLMIDADNFKAYNDLFGHQAGDKALVEIAGCIARGTRGSTDFAARYGGEELSVLLPGASVPEAYEVGERIRCAIEGLRGAKSDDPAFPTVSVGLACRTPQGNDTPCDLIAAADRALYDAKRNGRNCTALEPDAQLVEPSIKMVA
ncbi:MAG: sensor domain-containing diguanylate cyclase [Xanthobacteraceae bacterium]